MVRQGIKNIHYSIGHPGFHTFLLDAVGTIAINENSWLGYGEVFAKMDFCGVKQYEARREIVDAGRIFLPELPEFSPEIAKIVDEIEIG